MSEALQSGIVQSYRPEAEKPLATLTRVVITSVAPGYICVAKQARIAYTIVVSHFFWGERFCS